MHIERVIPKLNLRLKCGGQIVFDHSATYIIAEETISIAKQGSYAAAVHADARNEQVPLKCCAPFTDCISEMNNTQIDNTKGLDVVMPLYNMKEYSKRDSKTSGSLIGILQR